MYCLYTLFLLHFKSVQTTTSKQLTVHFHILFTFSKLLTQSPQQMWMWSKLPTCGSLLNAVNRQSFPNVCTVFKPNHQNFIYYFKNCLICSKPNTRLLLINMKFTTLCYIYMKVWKGHELIIETYNTEHLFSFLDDLYRRLVADEERWWVRQNPEYCVLVWDNVAFHHSLPVPWFTDYPRTLSHLIPRHSLLLNPAEEFFSSWWWELKTSRHMIRCVCMLDIFTEVCQGCRKDSFSLLMKERTEGVMWVRTCCQMQKTGLTNTLVFLYIDFTYIFYM